MSSARIHPADPGDFTTVDNEPMLVACLRALRSRLIKSLAATAIVMLAGIPFSNDLYLWVAEPMSANLPNGGNMIATRVTSSFLSPLKLTAYTAAFVTVPVWLWQLWAFVIVDVRRREQRFAVSPLVVSCCLFYAGVAFCYFVVFPLMFGFFVAVAPEGIRIMTDINEYLSFVLGMFLAFGLAFEVPIITYGVIRVGIVDAERLGELRPYVVVGAFILGALLTPPDVLSQILLAVPLCVLFEIGLLYARTHHPE